MQEIGASRLHSPFSILNSSRPRSEDSASRLNFRHRYNLGSRDYHADNAAVALLQLREV
jgi:hypothetical protein